MKAYFIGIGGIGVSALARYYLSQGWEVLGSDLKVSEVTENLEQAGAKIFTGEHKAGNLPEDADLVIYSLSVPKDNPELQKAKILNTKYQIPVLSYPEALGQLTKKYKTIAVAGAHGKTTTTALLALVMVEAGLDPTVIVGSQLKEFGHSNFRQGKSEYLLIEADEWQASFLHYKPWMAILTNIDKEHLEFYRTLENIVKTFSEFFSKLPRNGVLVINQDDHNSLLALSRSKFQVSSSKILNYSLTMPEAKMLESILKIPGQHNISNALAALTAARALDIEDEVSMKAFSKYQGAWRRLQSQDIEIQHKKITLITDYAHHPAEIEATLKAIAQKYGPRKVWAIIQPHQYARFSHLHQDFLEICQKGLCHRLTLTDIYFVEGRDTEELRREVLKEKSPQALIRILNTKYQIPNTHFEYQSFSLEKLSQFIKKEAQNSDVVVLMGAGDIHNLFLLLTLKSQNVNL